MSALFICKARLYARGTGGGMMSQIDKNITTKILDSQVE
jgi:hypothetical protein